MAAAPMGDRFTADEALLVVAWLRCWFSAVISKVSIDEIDKWARYPFSACSLAVPLSHAVWEVTASHSS